MRSKALLEVFLLTEVFILISVESKELRNETSTEIIKDHSRHSDTLRNTLRNGFISGGDLFQPLSVWGCDKYPSAVDVVTKRAIAFAKEVTTYLQSAGVENPRVASTNETSTRFSLREQKLNILREGINFYRDFSVLLKALWYDTKSAFSLLGEQLSAELELHISRLPFS